MRWKESRTGCLTFLSKFIVIGEVNMKEMTARELARLADWLKAQGFSAEQVLDCLHYITGTVTPPEK